MADCIEKKPLSLCLTTEYHRGWNDAVDSIVRCKDCKHWKNSGTKMGESFDNMQYVGGCEWSCFRRFENDYCSYGERKVENGKEI